MGGNVRSPFSEAGLSSRTNSSNESVRPKRIWTVDEVEPADGERQGVAETPDENEFECQPCEAEEEFGSRTVIPMKSPYKPSQKDVDDHYLTHLPYRNWCRHCVRGRGKEMAHNRGNIEKGEVPEFHFDFCFPRKKPGRISWSW